MADLRLGNNSIDNMMYGSTAVDKIYLGDTEVWSAIPADVKAHIARVTADGGTVPEQAKMVSMVKKLIAANLWNNCVFFGLPLGGVKKDGNQFVSKVYDLKANADLLQATGTAQPKYDNGNLLYDGGDCLRTVGLADINPIRNCINSISVFCWISIAYAPVYQFILNRWNSGALGIDQFFFAHRANGKLGVTLLSQTATLKAYDTTENVGSGWHRLGFTYSITNGLKIYKDGVIQAVTKTTDLANTHLCNGSSPIALSARTVTNSEFLTNGSKSGIPIIYNSELTEAQVLWDYNNLRPEGV